MHFLQHKFQMTVFALMTHLNPTCAVVNQRDTLFFQYGDGGVTLSSAMDRGLFSHTLSFNKRSDPVNMETMHCLLLNQLRESVVEPLSRRNVGCMYMELSQVSTRGGNSTYSQHHLSSFPFSSYLISYPFHHPSFTLSFLPPYILHWVLNAHLFVICVNLPPILVFSFYYSLQVHKAWVQFIHSIPNISFSYIYVFLISIYTLFYVVIQRTRKKVCKTNRKRQRE